MMDYKEFVAWLETEKNLSNRSARDVACRLRRVAGLLDTDTLDRLSVFELDEVAAFGECSACVKSQLRHSIKLYWEYSSK